MIVVKVTNIEVSYGSATPKNGYGETWSFFKSIKKYRHLLHNNPGVVTIAHEFIGDIKNFNPWPDK